MTNRLAPFFEMVSRLINTEPPLLLRAAATIPPARLDFLNTMSPERFLSEVVLLSEKAPQPKKTNTKYMSAGTRRFLETLLRSHRFGDFFPVWGPEAQGWSAPSVYRFFSELKAFGCVVDDPTALRGDGARKKLTPAALIYSVMQPSEPLSRGLLSSAFWNNVKLWSDFYRLVYPEFESASRFSDICYSAALALTTLGVNFPEGELTPEANQSATSAMRAVSRFFGVYQNNDAEWVESENPYGYFAADNAGAVLFDRLEAASRALWLEQLETPAKQQRKLLKSNHGPSLETEAPRPENPSPVLPDLEGAEPELPNFNDL